MLNKSVYKPGQIGIIIYIIGIIMNILNENKIYGVEPILIYFVFYVSSSLVLLSLYRLFQVIENNTSACRINLLGVFSAISILICYSFDILAYWFPSLLTFTSLISILKIIFILSNILSTLFIFSIYNYSDNEILDSFIHKLTLIFSAFSLIVNTLLYIVTIIIPAPDYNSFINKISLYQSMILLVLTISLLFTYKDFLQGLALNSKLKSTSKYGLN